MFADTCGGVGLDTRIAIYDGCTTCPPVGSPIACNDDSGADAEESDPDQDPDTCLQNGGSPFESATRNQVFEGNCYKIRVGSFGSTSTHAGIDELNIQCIIKGACCTDQGCVGGTIEDECDTLNGTFHAGIACDGIHACCLGTTCENMDPLCCVDAGGTPLVGQMCGAEEACCHGTDECDEVYPPCCSLAPVNGVSQGPGTTCNSLCGDGIVNCHEECDGGACCDEFCNFRPSSFECNPSVGICDAAEFCTGNSSACPLNGFSSGNECRPAADVCDVAEVCDGSGPDCPEDGFNTGNLCRPAAGPCDTPEMCDGTQAACPADGFNTGDICRFVNGLCDVAESCDGSGPDCPADGFSTGNVCRPVAGPCDAEEVCDGTMAGCPADGFTTGNICRPSAGPCDVADDCDGTSAACPADEFTSGNVCRPANGPCDVPETCPGGQASCPADGFSSGGVCRASTGPCDPEEVCSGAAGTCPPDSVITACVDLDGCCPSGCNDLTDEDCALEVPTVSQWGLLVLALALLAAAKVYFSRRRIEA